MQGFDLGNDSEVYLATKLIKVARPFVMLLETMTLSGQLTVTAAWRLYGRPVDAAPLDCFGSLIEQFALPARVGGLIDAEFVPTVIVPGFTGQPSSVVELVDPPAGKVRISASARMGEGGDLTVAWAYAFDVSAYESSVSRATG